MRPPLRVTIDDEYVGPLAEFAALTGVAPEDYIDWLLRGYLARHLAQVRRVIAEEGRLEDDLGDDFEGLLREPPA